MPLRRIASRPAQAWELPPVLPPNCLTQAVRHRRWPPNARQFVTTVYWPQDRTEGIEDLGSPQRAYGPDRCPSPSAPKRSGPFFGFKTCLAPVLAVAQMRGIVRPDGIVCSPLNRYEIVAASPNARDGRPTAAYRPFRSVSPPVRAGCVSGHRPCLGPVLSELPCGFFGAIERNGDYVSRAVLKSPRDQPSQLGR